MGTVWLLVHGLAPAVHGQSANQCDQPGETPDLIVGLIVDGQARYWGTLDGVIAYSFGSALCNIGTCWMNVHGDDPNHPVIAQNMYRLKHGRFEQIGQSWVKHTFAADSGALCSLSCVPTDGTHLGVDCSDTYASGTNGFQQSLGPKFEVNPHNGSFPFPFTGRNQTGSVIFKRLQVHEADMLAANNLGARYFVEVQYVAADETAAGRQDNNASFRGLSVQAPSVLKLTGTTQYGAAIVAWRITDPYVTQTDVRVPSDGIFLLAERTYALPDGWWHYEYALQNLNAHRPGVSFTVPIPAGVQVRNAGFHDVDYHSGELQEGTDWPSSFSAGTGEISWAAVPVPEDERRTNALRWGTLYNFRFEADAPPGTHQVTIGLLGPTGVVSGSTITPSRCDNDGICDLGETCAGCASDCANQGGAGGCCGDGSCQTGENATACFADCGAVSPYESHCGDGIDEDRDGSTDCTDLDCCGDALCTQSDMDGDIHDTGCDCDDTNATIWATPQEVTGLWMFPYTGSVALVWSTAGGATTSQTFYEAVRSPSAADFVTSAVCLPMTLPNANYPQTLDAESPPPGAGFFYLAHARNACPSGGGSWGTSSSGAEHIVRNCL